MRQFKPGDGKSFEPIKPIMPEQDFYELDNYFALGQALVVSAAEDLRECLRIDKDLKKYSCSFHNGKIRRSASLELYFFASPLCRAICNSIDPWYIVERIAKEEDYPYIKELKEDYERRLF